MNRVFHGDARRVVEDLPPVDLVVTDPPYGIGFNTGRYLNREYDTMQGDGDTEAARWLLQVLPQVLKPDAHAYIFTRWDKYPDLLPSIPEDLELSNIIVWDKQVHGMGDLDVHAPQHEFIMFLRRGSGRPLKTRKPDVIRHHKIQFTGEEKHHPTQKPVGLLRELIENSSDEGDLVLDPFAGSGSTLVAAKQLGRRYLGIEIEEQYVRTMRRRLRGVARQETLHAYTPSGTPGFGAGEP